LKKDKNAELFEEPEDDLTDSVQELSESRFLRDDELDDDVSDEDEGELERRRTAYSELKKNDKIFNNSYTMGQMIGEEIEETRSHTEIRIDPSSPDYQLYDRDQHSDFVDDSITQIDIHEFIVNSSEVKTLLGLQYSDSDMNSLATTGLMLEMTEKKKFDKNEVNDLFEKILAGVRVGKRASAFVNPVYVFDAISSLTGLEYKKLFDMLKYENKEILLLELDGKYHILEKSSKDFRIYE